MSRFLHRALKITKSIITPYSGVPSSSPLTLAGTAPAVPFKCRAKVTSVTGHTDCSGSLVIGTDTLTFLNSGQTKISTVSLTSLPVVTYTGLDCNILIECVSIGGSALYEDTETSLPCTVEVRNRSVPTPGGGWASVKSTTVEARGHFDVSDVIKFDIDNLFDPTNGDEYPIASWRPKVRYAGKESIKILEF